jgi:hypothetical protein
MVDRLYPKPGDVPGYPYEMAATVRGPQGTSGYSGNAFSGFSGYSISGFTGQSVSGYTGASGTSGYSGYAP